jgi:hypothetical protein
VLSTISVSPDYGHETRVELRVAFVASIRRTYIEVGHHLVRLCPLCVFRDDIVVVDSAIFMGGLLPNRTSPVHLERRRGQRPKFDELKVVVIAVGSMPRLKQGGLVLGVVEKFEPRFLTSCALAASERRRSIEHFTSDNTPLNQEYRT